METKNDFLLHVRQLDGDSKKNTPIIKWLFDNVGSAATCTSEERGEAIDLLILHLLHETDENAYRIIELLFRLEPDPSKTTMMNRVIEELKKATYNDQDMRWGFAQALRDIQTPKNVAGFITQALSVPRREIVKTLEKNLWLAYQFTWSDMFFSCTYEDWEACNQALETMYSTNKQYLSQKSKDIIETFAQRLEDLGH